MIKTNPFVSNTFVRYWSKHFLSDKKKYSFQFVKNLLFYKSKFPGLYINVGKNLTKGIDYEFDQVLEKEIKGKTFLIYDVIGFSKKEMFLKNSGLGFYPIKQYPGFLIELGEYDTLDDFISKTFKKSSRYKLRKYKKRLEECFNISFKAYHGEMLKKEYDSIFDHFRELLEKRFAQKKIYNNNLDAEEWAFYKDVAYPLIQEKKAALFVLYNKDEPISITLTYFSENRLFDAITVFDIDYAKFHLGSITIMKLIKWSIENNLEIFDFSKGYFDYKKRWATQKYDFEYHILYDSKSITSKFSAFSIKSFFEFKQFLRNKNVNEILHQLTFWLGKKKSPKKTKTYYEFFEAAKEYQKETLVEIDYDSPENGFLKIPVFDFLYLNNEKLQNTQVFQFVGENTRYLLKSKVKCLEMKVKHLNK